MGQPQGPTWQGLVVASLPMLGCMAVLAWRGLGQVRPLALATVRLVVQMAMVGVVLKAVFDVESPWVVLAAVAVMLGTSAYSVGARQNRGGWTLRLQSFA